MVIAIGVPKKKATPGGSVEGVAAKKHLGKRARGGRAEGGETPSPTPPSDMELWHGAGGWMNDKDTEAARQRAMKTVPQKEKGGGKVKRRAPGGAADDGPGWPDELARDWAANEATDRANKPDPQYSASVRRGTVTHTNTPGEPGGATDRTTWDSKKRGGGVAFRTKSGSVSAGARREAEAHGDAMPGGRFPIRNTSDLSNAKHAFGRANDKPAVKRWINKRARELGEPPMGG
jgi:hypothetical protein